MDLLHHLMHRPDPVKVADHHKTNTVAQRFNTRFALRVTNITGTMWCAYAFAVLALISLPAALATHSAIVIVAWIAQTFLQLVLLPVIMVGQNVQGKAADARAEATYKDTEAIISGLVLLNERQLALRTQLENLIPLSEVSAENRGEQIIPGGVGLVNSEVHVAGAAE